MHGGSPAHFTDHRKQTAVAAQSWILLVSIAKAAFRPLHSRGDTANQTEAKEADQQRADDGVQSSKRELLSRGRELRGAGRVLPDPFFGRELGPGALDAESIAAVREGGVLLYAASSAPERIGLPLGMPC